MMTLNDRLKSADAAVRRIAVNDLPYNDEEDDIAPLLAEALRDADAGVRLEAAKAAVGYEDDEVVKALAPLLKDADTAVREAAAITLAELKEPASAPHLLPFLAGAFFLGTVFLKAHKVFGRVYFADLTGAGLCGLLFLLTLYWVRPDDLIVLPQILWLAGSACWFAAVERKGQIVGIAIVAAATIAAHFSVPQIFDIAKLAVSDYKGVSYARKFPDSQRVYESVSPFGHLEVYSSSYLHFAPGLSDNAAFNLPTMPAKR